MKSYFVSSARALVLAAGLFATTTHQAYGGLQFWGFDNPHCQGPAVANVSDLMYFSSHVRSYIDASNPGKGCMILPSPG